MEKHIGIFINYGRGLKRQYAKEGIIRVTNLKPEESSRVIGWMVGWPEKEPKMFGRIVGQHGKSGQLMVKFRHGLPGDALGKKVQIIKSKPVPTKPKPTEGESGSKIKDIEGIGPKYAEKLNAQNIQTTADLLEAGKTPNSRKELAEKTGISHKLIHEWVNIADLFRIKGVGEEYSDLLKEAGVDTVVELSKRVPEHLHDKVVEVNKVKKLVRKVPTIAMIESWIEEAKTLPRKIEY
jgi:ribosomal protein L35AE/L33A